MTKKQDKTKSGVSAAQPSSSLLCHPAELDAITRRSFLSTGVSFAAWASLAKLVGTSSVARAAESFPPKRKLIWINMSGGWDILEVTDPKASSTAGIDMLYGWDEARTITGSDAKLGRWLPNIAALGKDVLPVRGIAMGTTSHMAGSVYMDTGVLSNTGRVNAASIPAIVASESTATIPIIQLNGGSEPLTDRGLLKPVSAVRAGNLDLYRSMYPSDASAIERRSAFLDYLKASITRLEGEVGTSDRIKELSAAESKVRAQFADNVAAKLALTDEDRAWFQEGAPENMEDGATDALALALKLVSGDVCTCINLGVGGYDTHQNQSTRLEPLLSSVDYLVGRLVAGLRAANKLDDTLIVLYSDFGRTPKVNGSNGRDHWPVGGAIMIGGGIDGGRVVGATDDDLRAADLVDSTTGLATTDAARGVQISPTHIGGAVLQLTLGNDYLKYRPYLPALTALTKLRSS